MTPYSIAFSFVVLGSSIALACGGSSAGGIMASVSSDGGILLDDGGTLLTERCTIASPKKWLPTSSVATPSARSGASAIWTGDRAIFFGGMDSHSLFDGGIYDPCTDRWATFPAAPDTDGLNTSLLPTPLWTGSRLIVWGGVASTSSAKTAVAATLDPKTLQWTAMSRVNEPTLARLGGVRAWTGERFVAWASTQGTAEGASWDPASNAWTKMSTAGAPQQMTGASGTWAGDRLFVWGERYPQAGPGQHAFFGATYEPAIDAWSSVAVEGAPQGDGASVFWTGKRVIVWARPNVSHPGGVLRALYDPKTGAWSPMAPSADLASLQLETRTPVWTGSELVVLGNGNDGTVTGLIYDPDANTWKRTSSIGAPKGYGFLARGTEGRVLVTAQANAPGTGIQNSTTFFVFDAGANTWTDAGMLTPRLEAAIAWSGRRIIAWGGKNTEIDPNGNDGCSSPSGNPCDPITPTKSSLLADGAAYGIP